MSFGLRLKRLPSGSPWPFNTKKAFTKEEIDRRVQEAAKLLGLENLLQRKPKQLSGGQRQRVALGRAIVREPKVFLMDEPLSNLDAKLRVQTRAELIRLHRRLGITTVYVTHDQVEAMTMGDRIAVMNHGVLQQCDTPLNLYNHPVNMFVAGFIGSPAMNFIPVEVHSDGGTLYASSGDFKLELGAHLVERAKHAAGRKLMMGIRPEDMHDKALAGLLKATPGNTVTVAVDVIEPLGNDVEMHITSGDHHMIAKVDSKTQAKPGENLELVIDLEKTHLFDIETEAALA